MAKQQEGCAPKEHQFVKVSEIDKVQKTAALGPTTVSPVRMTHGAVVVCAVCADTRHIFEDGQVVFINHGVSE